MKPISKAVPEPRSVQRMVGPPHRATEIPTMQEDGCSAEVLIQSHAGFYVGYYFDGEWYDSLQGEKRCTQFLPVWWWHLPERLERPNDPRMLDFTFPATMTGPESAQTPGGMDGPSGSAAGAADVAGESTNGGGAA